MCTALEFLIPTLIGAAVSGAGAIIKGKEDQKNAVAQAKAENQQLAATLKKNKPLEQQSRAIFDQRVNDVQPGQAQQTQDQLTNDRTSGLENAVTSAPGTDLPLSADAPEVVKSEIAKRMSEALTKGTDQAKTLGKVGGYGDFTFGQGLADNNAERNLSVPQSFISGNIGLLPSNQQFAAYGAYQPNSSIGDVFQGAGDLLASGGSYYLNNRAKKPYTPLQPVTPLA